VSVHGSGDAPCSRGVDWVHTKKRVKRERIKRRARQKGGEWGGNKSEDLSPNERETPQAAGGTPQFWKYGKRADERKE